MFINLSNHPSSFFGDKQTSAAQVFGEITDITFPKISPFAQSQEIDDIVNEYYLLVIEKINNREQDVVHIMGEMVFTHKLVNKLSNENIRCIASTTERRDDGAFSFVRFRDY